MTENNEQEIYLRPYLTGLWNKRYWIIGFGLLGVVLGLAISYLVAPTYEATALVASTLPRERIEFDSRIQTITDSQPLQAYPELDFQHFCDPYRCIGCGSGASDAIRSGYRQ